MTTPPTPPPPPPSPGPNGPGYGYPQHTPPPGAGGFGPPPGLPPTPGLPAAPGGGAAPPTGGGLRRNAVWAFVGAALASAGWAAAVLAIPGMVSGSSGSSAPRSLGSYHASDDFCTTGKPNNLFKTYSPDPAYPPTHHTDRNPALDSMTCSTSLKRIGDTTATGEFASVYLHADLHRAINPAPEFTAAKEAYRSRGYQITDIPGLGEEAYFNYKDDPGSSDKSWHSVSAEVEVRDGGMTYYISWSGSYTEGKGKPMSKEDLRTALQADASDAVRAMRK